MARYLPEGSAGLPSASKLSAAPQHELEANTYFGERGVPIDENTRFSNAPRTTRENAINIRAGVHDDDPSKVSPTRCGPPPAQMQRSTFAQGRGVKPKTGVCSTRFRKSGAIT